MTVDRCPITAAQDALTLLRRGRAAMAHRILDGLPALIEAQLIDARGPGFAEGWNAHLMAQGREMAPGRPAAPPASASRQGGFSRALPTSLPRLGSDR